MKLSNEPSVMSNSVIEYRTNLRQSACQYRGDAEFKRQPPQHRMRVALASPPQYESLVDLLRELHTYYNEGSVVPREMARSHLVDNLLGAESPLRLVVAYGDDGQVFGLAAISLTYSLVEPVPEQRRHCQLKELYVRSSNRGLGVGKAIMSWVAQYAIDHGCRRIDWPVKASNARGIAFYKGLGAQQVVERLSFRLSEPSLSQLANASGGTSGG